MPLFLLVHYFDPHAPYGPPEEFRRFAVGPEAGPVEREVALYDGEILFTDHQVGLVLEALDDLGLADHTLVVVAGDHGEGLMQRGHWRHGLHIYDEGVRVPLVLRWPGVVPAGRVVEEPVALVDLAPTVLDLLGRMPSEHAFEGESLAPALRPGGSLDPDRPILLQRRHFASLRVGSSEIRGDEWALRVGPWKYLEAPEEGRRELYHLTDDPGETENLVARHPEVATGLSHRLAERQDRHARGAAPASIPSPDAERLRILGYVD